MSTAALVITSCKTNTSTPICLQLISRELGELPGYALPKFSVNHSTGFTGFGAVGYGFGNGLRVEAEGLYNFSHDSYTDYANEYPAYQLPKGAVSVSCAPLASAAGYDSVQSYWNANGYPNLSGNPTPQNIMSGDLLPDKCWTVPQSTFKSLYDWSQDNNWPINKPYDPGVVPANPTPGTYLPTGATSLPTYNADSVL